MAEKIKNNIILSFIILALVCFLFSIVSGQYMVARAEENIRKDFNDNVEILMVKVDTLIDLSR